MARNKFLDRDAIGVQESADFSQIISNFLLEEFPNDPMLQSNTLTTNAGVVPPPVNTNEIAKRNTASGLLEIDADVSASYGTYNLTKLVPGIADDDLDDLLDDEFLFFIEGEDVNPFTPAPPVEGLFLLPINIDKFPNSYDYHDQYIQKGPETIPALLASGVDENDILKKVFCVWYIENGIGRPIPNYKTLEVMLVDRGLTYDSVARADFDDVLKYDLQLDGRFDGAASEDENGNPLPTPSPIDEFIVRSVIDKSYQWNARIRAKSLYKPGNPETDGSFLRDPGDYIRPLSARITNDPVFLPREARIIEEVIVPQFGIRPTTREQIEQDEAINDVFELASNLVPADPYDNYFDKAFIVTTLENNRAALEGRLVIPEWPVPYDRDFVINFSENSQIDDLFFDVGFMIYGHIKQIISLKTLKQIAEDFGVDYGSTYDASLEIPDPDGILDDEQYEALRSRSGIINVLVEAGAIKILSGKLSGLWPQFPKIGEANRMDFQEYEVYKETIFLSGGQTSIFQNSVLTGYEPPGSVAYYPAQRYNRLAKQAAAQLEIDQAKETIRELFPPLASKVAEFSSRLSGMQGGFVELVKRSFDIQSDCTNVLYDPYKEDASKREWRLYKQKNSGKVKKKGTQNSLFKLFIKEPQIKGDSFNTDSERAIFWGDGNISWHSNTKYHEDKDQRTDKLAEDLISKYKDTGVIQLINDDIEEAFLEAGRGGQVQVDGAKRYGRPEGAAGGRREEQYKNEWYFKGTQAAWILEWILDPVTYGHAQNAPVSPLGDSEASSLIDRCNTAEITLANLRVEIGEIEAYITDFDNLLLNATTGPEIIAIADQITASRSIVDDVNTELFAYLENLEKYIKERRFAYLERVYNQIQYVRKKVSDKNSKYWIEVPECVISRFAKYGLGIGDTGFLAFKPEGAYAI